MGNGILVICEQENGTFKTAYELLSKARFDSALGGSVNALVLGDSDGGNLAEFGAATIYVAWEGIGRKDTGALARATQAAMNSSQWRCWLRKCDHERCFAAYCSSLRFGQGLKSRHWMCEMVD